MYVLRGVVCYSTVTKSPERSDEGGRGQRGPPLERRACTTVLFPALAPSFVPVRVAGDLPVAVRAFAV